MKRQIVLLIVSMMILSLLPVQVASAGREAELLEVVEYEDGSYLEISVQCN